MMLGKLHSTAAMLFTTFSARIARNRRSGFRTAINAVDPSRVRPARPTQRPDATIDRTPFPFVTVSLNRTDLPVGLQQMGRTVRTSLRMFY